MPVECFLKLCKLSMQVLLQCMCCALLLLQNPLQRIFLQAPLLPLHKELLLIFLTQFSLSSQKSFNFSVFASPVTKGPNRHCGTGSQLLS